jgi:hypothetical protein
MAKQSKSKSQQRGSDAGGAAMGQSEDAVALLTADHRKVESLFEQYQEASDGEQKAQLAQQICTELNVHTAIEEEIFYPACREKGVEHSALDEAQVEHDGAKVLIRELQRGRPEDEYYDAKVKVLSDEIKHHVAEEERSGDGIFAKANAAGVEMMQLGQRLKTRKQELTSEAERGRLPVLPMRSLGMGRGRNHTQESDMERYGPARDEQGRYLPNDERGGGYFRGGYSARDYDEEEGNGRGYSRGGGRGWYGDPHEGWEQRRGGGDSRGGYEDERQGSHGGGSGRGHGGWFGDPEGHSQASEEGWGSRRGGGGYFRGGRDYEDERYGSRGAGGRGHGGDPEGHSRASEEGWEGRRGGGGGGGYYSRGGRDYEYERGYSSRSGGRGHGGWFGDPEGHSRASEEGWEHRRGGGYRGR